MNDAQISGEEQTISTTSNRQGANWVTGKYGDKNFSSF